MVRSTLSSIAAQLLRAVLHGHLHILGRPRGLRTLQRDKGLVMSCTRGERQFCAAARRTVGMSASVVRRLVVSLLRASRQIGGSFPRPLAKCVEPARCSGQQWLVSCHPAGWGCSGWLAASRSGTHVAPCGQGLACCRHSYSFAAFQAPQQVAGRQQLSGKAHRWRLQATHLP